MIKIVPYESFTIFSIIDEESTHAKKNLLPSTRISINLVNQTSLRFLKYCPEKCVNTFYHYNDKEGIYETLLRVTLKHSIVDFIEKFIMSYNSGEFSKSIDFLNSRTSLNIVSDIELRKDICISSRKIDLDSSCFLAFKNGILNLDTLELEPFSPDIFLTERLETDYPTNKNLNMPVFKKFIIRFCDGKVDLIIFLRCLMYAVIHGTLHLKLDSITILFGDTGNGKSVFQSLLRLLSNNKFITTTPDVLLKCRFELSNLQNKKLLIVSDLPRLNLQELELLKKISTHDSLHGLKKGSNGNEPFVFYGNIVIATNDKLELPIIDNYRLSALARRIKNIYVPSKTVMAKDRFDLLTEEPNNKFSGPIFDEIGYIVKWALSLPPQLVMNYFHNQEILDIISHDIKKNDPIALFLSNFVEFNSKSKIYLNKNDDSSLWGLYSYFCNKGKYKLLSNKTFNIKVVEYFNSLNMPVSKDNRDVKGFFFSNIRIKYNTSHEVIDCYFEMRNNNQNIAISSISKILFPTTKEALNLLFDRKNFSEEQMSSLAKFSNFFIKKDVTQYLEQDTDNNNENLPVISTNVIDYNVSKENLTRDLESKETHTKKSYIIYKKNKALIEKNLIFEKGSSVKMETLLLSVGMKLNNANIYKIISHLKTVNDTVTVTKVKKNLFESIVHNVKVNNI
jgi:phage/plasmid-associated DNA primase